jgi:hypothetical protein
LIKSKEMEEFNVKDFEGHDEIMKKITDLRNFYHILREERV